MNVLYFDQSQLWSPKIDDLEDEYDISMEDEEYHSINKNKNKTGKWLSLWVTSITNPSDTLHITIGEEFSMDNLKRKIINMIEQKEANFRGLKSLQLTELKRITAR